jgi:hypothetical protein
MTLRKIESKNKLSKIWSMKKHHHNLTLKTYLTSNSMKGSLHLCGIIREEIPSMIKGTMFYGLGLTSSRSQRNENTNFLPWMGERCHY